MQGTPRWWQNGRRVQAVLAENQTADVRLNIGPENDFWFTDDGNNPVAVLRVIGPVCPLDPLNSPPVSLMSFLKMSIAIKKPFRNTR